MKNTIKNIVLALSLVWASWSASAQEEPSLNPYVNQGIVSPAPLLPAEFNGTGVLSFNVGNTGDDPLPLVENQEMTLVITLSMGEPNNADPLAAVGGDGAAWFSWSYDPDITTYTATQLGTIPGLSSASITIQYKVTENSTSTESMNGFNINLQPPAYSNGINAVDDDQVSSYTYVKARDFGDAPDSYGSAVHEINVFKDPESREYLSYVHLGASVDPESANQPSDMANGDDLNGTDDEDGVTFPALVRGTTVTIPVVVTVYDFGSGLLNAWFDWDGDGVFETAERVPGPTVYGDGSTPLTQTVNLSVAIPADAVAGPTFARFRFGANIGSTGGSASTYGEVEDYQITISTPTAATLASFRATSVPGQGALLAWETLVEVATLGFHVDRSTASGGWERITPALVPATGLDQTPQSYKLADSQAPSSPDLSYRLMGIDLQGNERVLAEAQLQKAMSIASAVQGNHFTLNVNGLPNTHVSVEAAPTVLGPWTRLQTLTLEGNGSGKIEFEMDMALSAQFYRISSE